MKTVARQAILELSSEGFELVNQYTRSMDENTPVPDDITRLVALLALKNNAGVLGATEVLDILLTAYEIGKRDARIHHGGREQP